MSPVTPQSMRPPLAQSSAPRFPRGPGLNGEPSTLMKTESTGITNPSVSEMIKNDFGTGSCTYIPTNLQADPSFENDDAEYE